MASLAREVALACSVARARAVLGQRHALRHFPGVTLAAPDPVTARQTLELPFVGPEAQDVVLELALADVEPDASDPAGTIRFGVRGALIAYRGTWSLDAIGSGARARLTLDHEAAPALVERAINALRARSPLPLRTDGDAVLRRAVLDALDEHVARTAQAYTEAVAQLLAEC